MDSKDLKDVLGIKNVLKTETETNLSSRKKQKLSQNKKPDWISREVYSLLDDNKFPTLSLPVTPATTKPKIHNKPQKWIQKTFNSSARKDHMPFCHWVKENNDTSDHYYSKFNSSVAIPQLDKDEHDLFYKDDDWTFEETQYLFSLCQTFELRFHIIYDRYCYQNSEEKNIKNRLIENLKSRYYSVLMKMIRVPELRKKYNVLGVDKGPSSLKKAIAYVSYDENKEVERKKHLEMLYSRSEEEIKEEEMLLFELERIQNQKKNLVREREMVLKNLIPFEETVPTVVSAEPNIPEPQSEKKVTNKDNSTDKKPELIKKEPAETKKYANLQCYNSKVEPEFEITKLPNSSKQTKIPKRDIKLGSGAFLRSEKIIPVPKPRIEQVQLVLDHLNVACSNLAWPRPFMPTPTICDKFEKLQSLIIPLLDLKKVCDKTEAELCILEKRKRMLVSDLGEDVANSVLKKDS
ncbi:hypothetical protein BB561_002235 [Smittium simulii]|uniref:SWR1-complex protein 4 n=1 Tax=Smittium simulii TaxID=133385 RepID=A0A2T9YRA1_9FUNG|nr:hypothetical protein BB561_002235 [Smittium simulii]